MNRGGSEEGGAGGGKPHWPSKNVGVKNLNNFTHISSSLIGSLLHILASSVSHDPRPPSIFPAPPPQATPSGISQNRP